jgi:hypothetical protein
LEYFLVVHDEAGRERPEADGKFLSDTVEQRVSSSEVPITDVFFTSHGWKGDVPAAIEQYDKWIAAMAGVSADRDAVAARSPGFKALIVGLHWPSLPWGDESVEAAGGGVLGANDDVEQQVEAFARRIADTPTARGAIRTIVKEARARPASSKLSPAAEKAYAALFAESGLATGDAGARPGADQEGFDPAAIIADYEAGNAQGATQLLGFTETVRDAILSPLRQISFWKMKDRARIFGEAGGNRLLRRLQDVAPRARFHLMGHSFGCIVVSATVAGVNSRPLPRPVDSLFLVQGALSLWAYAKDIPYARGTPGYFYRVLSSRLVRGPIVTTRSKFDTAVGRFYPMGARIKQQLVLGNEKYPEYGGIGTFGIQGDAGAGRSGDGQGDVRIRVSAIPHLQPRGQRFHQGGRRRVRRAQRHRPPRSCPRILGCRAGGHGGSARVPRRRTGIPVRRDSGKRRIRGGVGRDKECATPSTAGPPTRSRTVGCLARGGRAGCSGAAGRHRLGLLPPRHPLRQSRRRTNSSPGPSHLLSWNSDGSTSRSRVRRLTSRWFRTSGTRSRSMSMLNSGLVRPQAPLSVARKRSPKARPRLRSPCSSTRPISKPPIGNVHSAWLALEEL